jgi:hypothetical protein
MSATKLSALIGAGPCRPWRWSIERQHQVPCGYRQILVTAGAAQAAAVVSVEPSPAFLCSLEQFEDHCERGPVRQAALRSDGAVTHGGEGAFNGIGSPQVFPVFGREVVEGEQRISILAQAVRRLRVFHRVALHECVERQLGDGLVALVSAIQISCNARLAFDHSDACSLPALLALPEKAAPCCQSWAPHHEPAQSVLRLGHVFCDRLFLYPISQGCVEPHQI